MENVKNAPTYGFASAPPGVPRNYPPQGYPQHGYPPEGYPRTGYPAQNYAPPPPQGFAPTPPQNYGPSPPQPLPPTTIVLKSDGWYSRNQKNKPQSNAVGAGALIFISGGMNIAWSIGFRVSISHYIYLHTAVAWFIAAIIGAVISSFLVNKFPKKFVLCFCSLLVMIGGIVLATTHQNIEAIEAALYLDGIANGLAFAPTMALAGELSLPYMRGTITSSIEQVGYVLGFFIQILYSTLWRTASYDNSFSAQQLHGALCAFYGLVALIFAALLCIDSPVIMLAKGEEQQAIDALRRLQRPYTITTETYEQLAEHKRYLSQNKDLSTSQSIVQGLPAFARLCFLRALNAMSLSTFVYYGLLIAVWPHFSLYSYNWQFVVFGICRWVGNFITCFCLESAGRKKPTLLGLLVSGGLAIGIGAIVHDLGPRNIEALFPLLCIFQFFTGITFTASSTYLSEAYPLGVKQHFIGSTFIVEMLVFIIISAAHRRTAGVAMFFFFFGAFSLVGFLLGIWCLPETRRTTLREAQDKFKGLISKAF